jgi:pimeloyl-ACP methyl ester carboxylesterase
MQNADIYQALVVRRETRHRVRGVDYRVHEWGAPEQPLIVFLHGWGDCGGTFQFVVDAMRSNWHVVAPDLRGFGDTNIEVRNFWFPDYLADLHALLDIYSKPGPVFIVGHSMGGNIAGLYAAAMPERVRAFVNLEGFGLPDSDPAEAPDRYRRWMLADATPAAFSTYSDFHALAKRIKERNPRVAMPRAEFVARCWARWLDGKVTLKANPLHKLPNPVLYRRKEAEACWRRLQAPVLLLAGAESEIAARVHPGTNVKALPFPNQRSAEIPASGHMLHFDAPATLAAAIEEFLLGCASSR